MRAPHARVVEMISRPFFPPNPLSQRSAQVKVLDAEARRLARIPRLRHEVLPFFEMERYAVCELELPMEVRMLCPFDARLPSWNDAREWKISEGQRQGRGWPIFQSAEYWASVSEQLSAENVTMHEYKYHLRELYLSKMRECLDQLSHEQRTLNSARETERLELRRMEGEDIRLRERRADAERAARLALKRRVDARVAAMRDHPRDHHFVCNGNEGTGHMPGHRFHPTQQPYWNDNEIASWRRELAVRVRHDGICSDCFIMRYFGSFFGAEREKQVREQVEAARLDDLESNVLDEVFQCEYKRFFFPAPGRIRKVQCRKKRFYAVLPDGWKQAKCDEWRRSLVPHFGTRGQILCPKHWLESQQSSETRQDKDASEEGVSSDDEELQIGLDDMI